MDHIISDADLQRLLSLISDVNAAAFEAGLRRGAARDERYPIVNDPAWIKSEHVLDQARNLLLECIRLTAVRQGRSM